MIPRASRGSFFSEKRKLSLSVNTLLEKSTLKPGRNLSFLNSGKSLISGPGHFYRGASWDPACHAHDTSWTVCTMCTLSVTTNDRFEGPTEARGLLLIFPLSGGSGGRLEADHGSVTEGRLAPPELDSSGRNHFLATMWPERRLCQSERKRRLLHTFSGQVLIPECTIFLI